MEYLHLHNETSWGWNPSLNMKLIHAFYSLYVHSLKAILCNIYNNFTHEMKFAYVEASDSPVSPPCHDVGAEEVSEFGAFWIPGFQVREAQLCCHFC